MLTVYASTHSFTSRTPVATVWHTATSTAKSGIPMSLAKRGDAWQAAFTTFQAGLMVWAQKCLL